MQFWPINLIPRYLGSGFNKKGKINEAASHSPRLHSSPAGESVRAGHPEGRRVGEQANGVEWTETDRQRGGICQLTMSSAV